MEAFKYHQHQSSFILDPAPFISSPPIDISPLSLHHLHAAGEMSNASSSCFTSYNSSEACMQEDSTTSLKPQLSLNKKRRNSDGSCLSTDQSKGGKENKIRRRNKPSGASVKEKVEEPPSGYIHVRARRGQATDSHSLAERVRRERISERMRKLQGLVPGCDKVVGKALVLDEIINYVQSLQNQVEVLSMKLATISPIFYDFGDGIEEYMSQAEEMGRISQSFRPSAFDAAYNSSLQQVMDPAAPPNFNQGSGSFLTQVELNNMCTFQ